MQKGLVWYETSRPNRQAVRTLQNSIEFASKILDIPTDNIEPLFTVLEKQPLQLRDDLVNEGNCREAILSNASVTEEEYLVTPLGNIPFEHFQHIPSKK